jgi:integrase
MKLSLKKRKLKDGRYSLYLELYKGYSKDNEGKIKHYREKETLKLYTYQKPKNAKEKQHNKEIEELAEQIKAKRFLELKNGEYGFKSNQKAKANFLDYFSKLTEERKASKGNYGNWDSVLKHLHKYCHKNTTFQDIDKSFVEGFKVYLTDQARTKTNKPLAKNTQVSYFNKLRAAINQAFEEGIISKNPLKAVKGIKAETPQREYLTLEELRVLAATDCDSEVLKKAFLFSCLTGLRWSDINKMTWGEVQETNDGGRLIFKQQKTKGQEYLDINNQAYSLLGEREEKVDRVFKGLKYSAWNNLKLQQWVMKAGISKTITFHCARHTFATLQLTLDTDIYTLQKLLGHKNLKTTEVYAKIIDQKKKDAVNKIPDINL